MSEWSPWAAEAHEEVSSGKARAAEKGRTPKTIPTVPGTPYPGEKQAMPPRLSAARPPAQLATSWPPGSSLGTTNVDWTACQPGLDTEFLSATKGRMDPTGNEIIQALEIFKSFQKATRPPLWETNVTTGTAVLPATATVDGVARDGMGPPADDGTGAAWVADPATMARRDPNGIRPDTARETVRK